MVINLCILSDHTLYLYQVSQKYLKGFKRYLVQEPKSVATLENTFALPK